jgi:hypothetical protein
MSAWNSVVLSMEVLASSCRLHTGCVPHEVTAATSAVVPGLCAHPTWSKVFSQPPSSWVWGTRCTFNMSGRLWG